MPLPAEEIDRAVAIVGHRWEALRGARILLTGGTGFFGRWLMETLLVADQRFSLHVQPVLLTRDRARCPSRWQVEWIEGDARSFHAPGAFTHAILGATSASASLNRDAPREMFDVVVDGTRHGLAQISGAQRLLFLSSGAVYGPQPVDLPRLSETFRGGPDPLAPGNAYAIGKLAAEHLVAEWGRGSGTAVVVARAFAFVGPHLPLDQHFAIGNFLADALAGRDILVQGDGTPYRSYLHASDLAAWLWTLLLQGSPGQAYNVGSDEGLPLAELAALVASIAGVSHRVLGTPRPGVVPARYVPDTLKAREELGLLQSISLAEAIRRTLAWHRS